MSLEFDKHYSVDSPLPPGGKCQYNRGRLRGGIVTKAAALEGSPGSPAAGRRETAVFYGRIQRKLGAGELHSDQDLARLVEQRLPLTSVESLISHGLSDDEIYRYVVPRRTLVHRRSKCESLTHDESDRAVRIARITSLAEEVFGDDAKAGRWLRKPKTRFEGRTPMEVLRTEAGARLVEEMLLQLDYGFFA